MDSELMFFFLLSTHQLPGLNGIFSTQNTQSRINLEKFVFQLVLSGIKPASFLFSAEQIWVTDVVLEPTCQVPRHSVGVLKQMQINFSQLRNTRLRLENSNGDSVKVGSGKGYLSSDQHSYNVGGTGTFGFSMFHYFC